VHYGDPIALENLHNMAWLGDGVHQLKVRMRQAQPNEWFDLVTTEGKGLNNRDPVMNGDKVLFRNPKSDEVVSRFYKGRLGHYPFKADASTGEISQVHKDSEMKVFIVCPSYKNQVCNNKGSCVNNKCKCFAKFEGAACHRQRAFGLCHAVGDPHWKTWDGLYINLYSYGEYLQYTNPRSETNEAVTAFLVKLRATSVVSVQRDIMVRRSGEIVKVVWPQGAIHVNCKDVTAAAKKTGATGYVTKSGLKLVWHNQYWFVTSPSGLQVQVRTYGWGQNLWLRIHEPKDGQQRGMCGDFNGDPKNDVGLPARKAHNQPSDEYISSIFVPPKYSLRSCASAARDYAYFLGESTNISPAASRSQFAPEDFDASAEPLTGISESFDLAPEDDDENDDVHLRKADEDAPPPGTSYSVAAPPLTAVQVGATGGALGDDPLSPDQRARVNLALKDCPDKEKALASCKTLFEVDGKRTDGRSEAADCVEDECATGDAREFVAAAVQTAKHDVTVKEGIAKANAKVNELELKEEKTVKRFVGAPDADDEDTPEQKEDDKTAQAVEGAAGAPAL
jgi:hypothetical protein